MTNTTLIAAVGGHTDTIPVSVPVQAPTGSPFGQLVDGVPCQTVFDDIRDRAFDRAIDRGLQGETRRAFCADEEIFEYRAAIIALTAHMRFINQLTGLSRDPFTAQPREVGGVKIGACYCKTLDGGTCSNCDAKAVAAMVEG